MELIIYLLVMLVISVGIFWFLGSLYGLLRKPAIYFPFSLAAKMALVSILGIWFMFIGGIIFPALIFDNAMSKRSDYKQWPSLIAGGIISLISIPILYYLALILAFKILE